MSTRHETRATLGALFLITATFICYIPALRGGFIWDDDRHVAENRMLRSARGLWRIWFEPGVTPQYYPLTHTSFWIEYHAWGARPAGYHFTNVLLHSINALLVWRLLTKLDVRGAYVAAMVFALHPVNVESVAWISERKNVLAMMFMLGSILAYLRSSNEGRKIDRQKWWLISLVAFAGALFSKTVTCSTPGVIALILWWKGRLTRREMVRLIPFFILGAAMGLMTARMERLYVGAAGPEWDFSFASRCVIAGRAIWFYLGKLLVPIRLTFSYPQWSIAPHLLQQWIPVLAVIVVVMVLYSLRRRIGRGPIVAVLIFIGTIFPALGFFNTYPMRYTFVADHFQYISCVAVIALIVAALSRIRATPIVALLVPVLGVLTFMQCRAYASHESIWRDTLAKNPHSWMAAHNLGLILSSQADAESAAGRVAASQLSSTLGS